MKKLIFVFGLLFILSGCSLLNKSEFAIAMNYMEKIDGYRMDFEMTHIAYDETIEFYSLVEGDFLAIDMMGEKLYYYFENDKEYILERSGGLYIAVEDETSESMMGDNYDNFSLFGDDGFTKEGDYFVTDKEIMGMKNIKIKIGDGKVKEMIFDIEEMSELYNVVINYSEYNDVDVNFPKFIKFSEYEILKTKFQDIGYTLDISGHIFIFNSEIPMVIDFIFDEEGIPFMFLEYNVGYYYYPDSKVVRICGNVQEISISKFLELDIENLNRNLFDALDELYELYILNIND